MHSAPRSSSLLRTSHFNDDELGFLRTPYRSGTGPVPYDMRSRSATSITGGSGATSGGHGTLSTAGKCFFPVDTECGITEQQWETVEIDMLPLEQMCVACMRLS